MTGRSGHSSNCERAEKPPCACACGGAEHGWQEALAIAAAPTDRRLLEREKQARQAWEQAKPRTAAGQHAAIKSFVVEVIRWLRGDPDLYERTKQVGEPFRISRDTDPNAPRQSPAADEDRRFVEAHVIPELRKRFGDERIREFQKKAVGSHFWCELLAQIAHALDEFRGRYNRAKKAVLAALTSNDELRPKGWASLLLSYQDVIERAVKLVFKLLSKGVTGGISVEDALNLIWPARVLAVLMCREPRRHPAVREYCVKPIVEDGTARIKGEVKDRLGEAFDWPEPSTSDEDASEREGGEDE